MTFIAFTGHRPKDLPFEFNYQSFAQRLDSLGIPDSDSSFIAGGALGVDTFAAEYALQRGLPLHLHLPFTQSVMSNMWHPQARATLARHADHAVSVRIIHPGDYDVSAYQLRNESMVHAADVVYAVWTGRPVGGTANCIRFALKRDVPVYNLLPLTGGLHPVSLV